MIKLEFSHREIISIYLLLLGIDLFFIIMTAPGITLPVGEGMPTVSSVSDFIRFQLDLKQEKNLATWYSSVILLITGLCALLNNKTIPSTSKNAFIYRTGWILVALLCIGISADETATIHESLAPLKNLINKGNQSAQIKLGAGDWLPILLPMIIISAAGMLLFFWLNRKEKRQFLLLTLIGVLCWIGALVFESIEGGFLPVKLSRSLEGVIEEGFEIVGTTFLFIGFVEYYRAQGRIAAAETSKKSKHALKHSKPFTGNVNR